jgi:hypothetical protein
MYMSSVNKDMSLAFHNFGDVYICDYLESYFTWNMIQTGK